MDISIMFDQTKFNYRVAIILLHHRHLVLEQSRSGFYFPIGGRVKIGESSQDAACREVFEEIGYRLESLAPTALIENFFTSEGTPFHEICMVYRANIRQDVLRLPAGFSSVPLQNMENIDIRPDAIKALALTPHARFRYICQKG